MLKRIILDPRAKKAYFFVVFALFLPLQGHSAEKIGSDRFAIHVSEWFSDSDSTWEISDSGFDAGLMKFVEVRSRLDFKRNKANLTTIGAEWKATPSFSLQVRCGSGDIKDGRVVDSDWISVPADSVSGLQFSESKADGDGDTSIFEIGAKVKISHRRDPRNLNFYAGYFYYEDDITITNGLQTLSDPTYTGVPVGDVLTGLNSTYRFRWQYLKIGLEGESSGKKRFRLHGSLYYLHLIDYEGKAFWNLRVGSPPNGFRTKSPNFIHDADDGSGVEALLAISGELSPSGRIFLGYRYFELKAEDGNNKTFYASGAVGMASLDSVEVERKGPFIALEVSF